MAQDEVPEQRQVIRHLLWRTAVRPPQFLKGLEGHMFPRLWLLEEVSWEQGQTGYVCIFVWQHFRHEHEWFESPYRDACPVWPWDLVRWAWFLWTSKALPLQGTAVNDGDVA